MNLFEILGTVLNLAASIVALLPFFVVFGNGKVRLKTKKDVEDESATYVGGNPHLAKDLLLSQRCALASVFLLILGTTCLLLR